MKELIIVKQPFIKGDKKYTTTLFYLNVDGVWVRILPYSRADEDGNVVQNSYSSLVLAKDKLIEKEPIDLDKPKEEKKK